MFIMTRKVRTITLLTTLLFVNVVSAFSYQNTAKTIFNNTCQAATDLNTYVKKHPIASTALCAGLLGIQRIKNGLSFAEEHPIVATILAITVIGAETSTFE
jgi:hypothetical protein